MANKPAVLNKISALRERYYKASTGKGALIKLVSEAEVAEQVYNSNAIENSRLTLEETVQTRGDTFQSEGVTSESCTFAKKRQ